ncbi:expressed protein [Echinococcus multilocularis]|uniref:Expressed protein n=1 Tax=Echinococcus multilocularis TaxID=6211 RepID=A0A068YJP3_ECHMU|nr:expressed protein [Echinococcus multilocularis]
MWQCQCKWSCCYGWQTAYTPVRRTDMQVASA